MAQILFGPNTAPTEPNLDLNFTDLYNLRELIATPSYTPATTRIAIDASGNVAISGSVPVGSNRVLEVGNSSRAITFIRSVCQTVGSVLFEALAAGFDTLLVGVNNSGAPTTGIPTGTAGIMTAAGTPIVIGIGATEMLRLAASQNITLNGMTAGTAGAKLIAIANGTAPTTSPAGGGQMYVEAGALKYRGSSGTITVLGAA